MVRVLIAEGNHILRKGLYSILEEGEGIEVVEVANNRSEMYQYLATLEPTVVLFDYLSNSFLMDDISNIKERYPSTQIVGITDTRHRTHISGALKMGVSGHVLKVCSPKEICDAVVHVSEGKRFYCGKILDVLGDELDENGDVSCEPVSLSMREIEIIKEIASGASNKQIASKLFLSAHTVMTHRKNIMSKLGVNNTAGLVIYAVKENLIQPNRFLFDKE